MKEEIKLLNSVFSDIQLPQDFSLPLNSISGDAHAISIRRGNLCLISS